MHPIGIKSKRCFSSMPVGYGVQIFPVLENKVKWPEIIKTIFSNGLANEKFHQE